MRVLLDTNVLLDLCASTGDFLDSYRALDVALFRGFEACVTALSVQTFAYLLPACKLVSQEEAMGLLGKLLDTVSVIDVTAADCRRALEHFSGDYEDDLVAWAAHRNGVDVIVTRNKRDFAASPVAAVSPKEFADLHQPACLAYDEASF